MSIFKWKSRIYSNTDGTHINGSRKITGIAWNRWCGLSRGWAIHINITAWSAHQLGVDVESLIVLNMLHEISHLCAPGSETSVHGSTEEEGIEKKISIIKWNRFIASAMGHRRLRSIFDAQMLSAISYKTTGQESE